MIRNKLGSTNLKVTTNLDELIDHLEYLLDLSNELQEGIDDLLEMEILTEVSVEGGE